jgi:hypothetical protein
MVVLAIRSNASKNFEMFENVRPNLFSTLNPSFSWSTHSFHNYQCNNSICFQRAKFPFIILYVMTPFLDPTLGAIGPQKRHLKCLDWLELISKEDKLLGTKKAQAMTFWLWAFQKSRCYTNVAHCWFASMVVEFATSMVLAVEALTDASAP